MKAWRRLPVSIEAVCDADLERARAFAAAHRVPAAFGALSDALAAVAADFVDVAAGPEAHPDLVEQAVAAGCHVLCQKPLATDLAGAERIVAAAGRGRVVAVNEMWKHLPGYAIAREFLATGAAGELRGARIRQVANVMLTQEDGSPPRRLQAGGQVAFATIPRVLLFDFGVHLVDLARALFGAASLVDADVGRLSPHLRGDDGAWVRLRFAPGFDCTIDLDWCAPGPPTPETIDVETLVVAGSRGMLTVEAARTVRWLPTGRPGWVRVAEGDRREAAFEASHRNFVDAIERGTRLDSPPADHLENLRIVLDCYERFGS
jgi:predicted dehydrogenase